MNYNQKPYELSLWDDRLIDNTMEEVKICTISSELMSAPIKAYNIVLNKKVNGENTLTFSVAAKYFDQELGEYQSNPFLPFLINERKIKLKRLERDEYKWYDFVIKNISEDSSSQIYNYTAKDLHISELSKNGFQLEFDKELQNNTDTAEALGAKILKDTDWSISKDTETLLEYTEEPVYRARVKSSFYAYSMPDNKGRTFKTGEYIYVPYSIIQNQESKRFQFISTFESQDNDKVVLDDDNVLLRDYYVNFLIKDTVNFSNGIPSILIDLSLQEEYRCAKLISEPLIKYDSILDKYVSVYSKDNKTYYGFTETEYLTPDAVFSLMVNAEEPNNKTGWFSAKIEKEGEPSIVYSPSNPSDWTEKPQAFLKIKNAAYNSGVLSNRTKIKEFTAGEKYILEIKLRKELENDETVTFYVAEYKVDDGKYQMLDKIYFKTEFSKNEALNSYYIKELQCKETVTEELMKKTKIGIFISTSSKSIQFKNISFYKKIEVDGEILKPGEIVTDQTKLIKLKHFYYDPESDYTSISDIVNENTSFPNEDTNFTLQYNKECTKKRTITAKESNRFNLLQKICETFECWMRINVTHDQQGKILKKQISFHEYVGKQNYSGFKYGINLKSIKRTIDSTSIVSKVIVKDNANEFATNGFCSITRSSLNPSGTNAIYNFDYYIKQNLFTYKMNTEALYDKDTGLYSKLFPITQREKALIEQKIPLEVSKMQLEASQKTAQAQTDAAEEEIIEVKEDIKDTTTFSYEDFMNINFINNEDLTEEKKEKYSDWKKDEVVKNYLVKIFELQDSSDKAQAQLEVINPKLEEINKKIVKINEELKQLAKTKNSIETNFFKKYSRFIQEGQWSSEDYTNDDRYYLDALATGFTSSRPKISYTIDVFDLSGIEEYENYNFEIGDKTFVEDTEFFGWKEDEDGSKIPYHEEVIISEITSGIDDLTKNTIKVQNYKTQFEDLFQRIAASTEQLQFNTGRYERSAKVVQTNGAITHEAIQQTVTEKGLVISNNSSDDVVFGKTGLASTNSTLPTRQVRLAGEGLQISGDGGESWKNCVTGKGINADVINAGQLNTSEVNIYTGAAMSHKWDNKGITAYQTVYKDGVITETNNSNFVRFDEFGLYGIENNANFDARITDGEGDQAVQGVAKIRKNSSFSLTFEGLTLGDFEKDGIFLSQKGETRSISIANTNIKDTWLIKAGNNFGVTKKGAVYCSDIKINGLTENITTYQIRSTGNTETIAASTYSGIKVSTDGFEEDVTGQTVSDLVFMAGSNFGVTKEGKIYSNSGNIGGWEISSKGFSYNTEKGIGAEETAYLIPAGQSGKISADNSGNEKTWVIAIGKSFGVTSDGGVYCNSGNIGGWEISNDGLGWQNQDPDKTEEKINLKPSGLYFTNQLGATLKINANGISSGDSGASYFTLRKDDDYMYAKNLVLGEKWSGGEILGISIGEKNVSLQDYIEEIVTKLMNSGG